MAYAMTGPDSARTEWAPIRLDERPASAALVPRAGYAE